MVQEVVSEALLNNVANTDYSHEKKSAGIFSLLLYGSSGYFNMCTYLSHPKKLVPENRSFMKIGSTIKGKDHRSNLAVGEDSS